MNNVLIQGRIERDPAIRATSKGTAVASFSVATERTYGDKTFTDWINVVAWGKLAESVGNNLVKGDEVVVNGRMGTRSYEKDGQKRYVTEVTANFIGKSIVQSNPEEFGDFSQFGTAEPDSKEPIPF